MNNFINNLISQLILSHFGDFVNGAVDFFSTILNNVFIISQRISEASFISKMTILTFKLAVSLLILLSIKQVINLYILNEGGEPEYDMAGFFVRLGKSAILISFSSTICSLFITFSNKLANDVMKQLSGNIDIVGVIRSDVKMVIGMAIGNGIGKGIVILIFIIILIVCLLIIAVQAGLRGVNLAVLQMTAPIFASNYITTDKALWNKWVQNMFSVSLTYVFQIALTNIALKYFAQGLTGDIVSPLIGLAWLIVTIQSPKILKEFSYSTGVGGGISKLSSTALSVSRFIR